MPLPMELGFLGVGFVIFTWIPLRPRQALHVLFFGQKAVRELTAERVRMLRILSAIVAISVLVLLAGWAITGRAP